MARSWCRRAYLENRLEVVKSYLNTEEMKQNEMLEKLEAGGEEEAKGEVHPSGQKYQPIRSNEDNPPVKSSPQENEFGEEHDKMIEMKSTHYRAEELRGMSLPQIESILEEKLVQIARSAQGGGVSLSPPLNRNQNIASFGLDSMLITQYKGVLENRLHCQFPDEFMFTKRATISELALIVKHGQLTEAQTQYLENIADDDEEKNDTTQQDENIVIDNPICPWFTCCY